MDNTNRRIGSARPSYEERATGGIGKVHSRTEIRCRLGIRKLRCRHPDPREYRRVDSCARVERDDALQTNCDPAVYHIDLFKQHRKVRSWCGLLLPEVWYVGSEIELHTSCGIRSLQKYSHSKCSFLSHAHALYDDYYVLYRYIVSSAFSSEMGAAIVSAEWAARVAIWWIRSEARYVPATCTGLAYFHHFKFMYWAEDLVWSVS
ncbi:hypothetical protein K432DRAFT_214892 [Lepidopterella palustris CBS 459.81]|uniref:Uncharacterized protein n=1 Tax=Lepidopterella palustris CBS 459.81 TaxID=1314670 RepID=A0A8E2EF43_9PEZI|nr:hypothetical protein K432DRAFT_214892 [Lepidopterella palustris CBS 459.81]